jgi:hypothetical protein
MGTHGKREHTQAPVLYCLPLIKEPEQRLELEHCDVGEEDRVCIRGTLDYGTDLGHARKREHRIEDERVLGQEVPVNTEKTVLDLQGRGESERRVTD